MIWLRVWSVLRIYPALVVSSLARQMPKVLDKPVSTHRVLKWWSLHVVIYCQLVMWHITQIERRQFCFYLCFLKQQTNEHDSIRPTQMWTNKTPETRTVAHIWHAGNNDRKKKRRKEKNLLNGIYLYGHKLHYTCTFGDTGHIYTFCF